MSNGKEYTEFEKEMYGWFKTIDSRLDSLAQAASTQNERLEKGFGNHSERIRKSEDKLLIIETKSGVISLIVSFLVSATFLVVKLFKPH